MCLRISIKSTKSTYLKPSTRHTNPVGLLHGAAAHHNALTNPWASGGRRFSVAPYAAAKRKRAGYMTLRQRASDGRRVKHGGDKILIVWGFFTRDKYII